MIKIFTKKQRKVEAILIIGTLKVETLLRLMQLIQVVQSFLEL